MDKGFEVTLLEADQTIGGRVQTDLVDGYRFDRGFQVLQLAYPAAKKLLDYDMLEIKKFPPGVRIRAANSFHVLADPLRKPAYITKALFSKVGTFADRLKLARLAVEVNAVSLEKLFEKDEMLVQDFLVSYGFSDSMITRFFKPFMTGVCLDPGLQVTNRFLLFVLRMFVQGDVGVPALGMGEIPKQLAKTITAERIVCNAAVESLEGTTVTLENGQQITGEAVVLATPAPETARLLGKPYSMKSSREMCFYYSTREAPIKEPFLTLNGEENGLINSVNFSSMVAPDYAPAGSQLISAVVPGYPDAPETEIEKTVRNELKEWFGNQTDTWEMLRSYTISHALPQPAPPSSNPFMQRSHLGNNIFDCSELSTMPAIQWALLAGERAAEEVTNILKTS
nr:NAD(P)/FAD-dependent oxidoreductase [Desulfosediminicola flagellatus]